METHLESLLFAFPTDTFFYTPIYFFIFLHSRLVSLSLS